jgi:hypothetical protein
MDHAGLARILLGERLGKVPLLVMGAVIGSIPNLDMGQRLDPLAMLPVPAWTLYVLTTLVPFLRLPRTENLAFVLGVPYRARTRIARQWVNRRFLELAAILAIASGLWLALRSLTHGFPGVIDTTSFVGMMAIEAVLGYGVSLLAVVIVGSVPSGRDKRPFALLLGSFVARHTGVAPLFAAVTHTLSAPFRGSCRLHVRRQLLYLLRFDPFSGVVLPAGACVLALLSAVAIGPPHLLAQLLVLTTAQVFACMQMSAALMASVRTLRTLPYYDRPDAGLHAANLVPAALWAAPLLLLHAADTLIAHGTGIRELASIGILGLVQTGTALTFAAAWDHPAWHGFSIFHTALVMLLSIWSMMALAYSSVGYAASVAFCAVGIGLLRRHRQRTL